MEWPEVLPNRINIDTGAFASGRLTYLLIENDQDRFLFAAWLRASTHATHCDPRHATNFAKFRSKNGHLPVQRKHDGNIVKLRRLA
jgi:hypothetical protein